MALGAGCALRGLLTMRTVRVDERVRVFLGGGGNSVAVLHGDEAFLADAKMGNFARLLRRELEEELGRKVQRLLVTHAHFDHAQGLPLFRQAGAVLVHPRTRARLEQEQALRWMPFVEVEEEVRVWLGGEEVRVIHLGVGHTDGDLVALLPAHRLLVAGDLVTNGLEPFIDVQLGGDIAEYRKTLDRLFELPFERVVPGHGPIMERAEAMRQREYLSALEGAVAEAIAAGQSEDAAASSVLLPEFSDLEGRPVGGSRVENVRLMYRALKEAARK